MGYRAFKLDLAKWIGRLGGRLLIRIKCSRSLRDSIARTRLARTSSSERAFPKKAVDL